MGKKKGNRNTKLFFFFSAKMQRNRNRAGQMTNSDLAPSKSYTRAVWMIRNGERVQIRPYRDWFGLYARAGSGREARWW